MSITPTTLEVDLRQRLHDQDADVTAPDAMRMRVLTALEDDSSSPRRVTHLHRRRDTRPFLLLAGVAAAVAVALVVFASIGGRTETVEVITADPTIPDSMEPAVRLDSASVDEARNESSLEEAGGDWTLISDTEGALSIGFGSVADDDPSRILRIVTPPAGTTPEDVVVSISSTLFDTALVDASSGNIGGLESRAVRLETQAGTTRLGFRIAADTYIETAGTDRVFVVHITTGQPQTVVFWIEASATEIDDFEATAARLVEALGSE